MTIAEKVTHSANCTLFTLHKEGLFYKCYNEDAMVFVQRVRAYKVTAKFIKSAGETDYSVGFPVGEVEKGNLSLSSILEKIGSKVFEIINGNIVFLPTDIGIKNDYEVGQKAAALNPNISSRKLAFSPFILRDSGACEINFYFTMCKRYVLWFALQCRYQRQLL